MTSADLAPERLLPALRTKRLGRSCSFLPACGSTNDEVAKRAAEGAAEGLLIAANQQSSGRGRRGRVWHSPPGENLYFSLLLRPALPAHVVSPLPLLAGAALAQALASFAFSPRLKWPNDLLIEGALGLRKVAGILAEMSSEHGDVRHLVLGVGVNVNAGQLPADLVPVATSLRLQCGHEVDRLQVLAAFLNLFEPLYDDFLAHGSAAGLAAWRKFAAFGQRCRVRSGSRSIDGVAENLDPSGALLVRTSDGTLIPVHAGEVDWPKSA